MSVEIRVRRFEKGQPYDEVIEHIDTDSLVYGYNLLPDSCFRVLAVEVAHARDRLPHVETVRAYSAGGYLEVSGTRMLNDMGTTAEDLRGTFGCNLGEDLAKFRDVT